jgi:hypothetical protein
MELHTLRDKLARNPSDYGPEVYTLLDKRERVAASFRGALRHLTDVIAEATALLRVD